jgi:hypothetical protein
MELIERKYTISTSDLGDCFVYVTKFKDYVFDNIWIYRRVGEICFTDGRDTASALDCFVPNWREDGTVEKICKRYGCKMKGNNEELQAPHGSQLVQAILAIYAWIEFKECGL